MTMMISKSFVVCCVTIIAFNIWQHSNAVSLSRRYKFGPVKLTSKSTFYFEAKPSWDVINFAIIINDSAIVDSGANWLAIGIGEATSGSIVGTDLVTAEFAVGVHNICTITDRYVPFAASPLLEDPVVSFQVDECVKSDWTLISCSRQTNTSEMILEIKRPISAKDSRQDRAILPGLSSVLHLYGKGEVAYENATLHSTKVKLYNLSREDAPMVLNGLPNDVTQQIELRATTFEIPSQLTTRACTSKKIPIENGSTPMIVNIEPVINDESVSFVQYMSVFLCSGEAYANDTSSTIVCEDRQPYGPLGNAAANCSAFVFGYSRGTMGFRFPRNVGLPVNEFRPYLVMETFYTNIAQINRTFDTSGVRVYMTSKSRRFAAGSLFLGDPLLSRQGHLVSTGKKYQHSCPKSCTSRFNRAITVFNSFSYMRSKGRSIYTNMFQANGQFVQTLSKINFWNEEFPMSRTIEPVIKLRRGDQLQTTCIYDASKGTTIFGVGSSNEICVEILTYWPVQSDPVSGGAIELCAFMQKENTDRVEGFTICGDSMQMDSLPVSGTNPAFNDTIDMSSQFGMYSAQCPAASESISPSEDPSTSEENLPKMKPSVTLDSESSIDFDTNEADFTNQISQADSSGSPSSELFGTISPMYSPSSSVSTVPSASSSQGEVSTSGGSLECFSASMLVRLSSGIEMRMDEVKVGDEVLVEHGKYSRVFLFTHADHNIRHEFVEIFAENDVEQKSIVLSPGHFLPVNFGELKRARQVQVGDSVWLGTGGQGSVSNVSVKWDIGLFNPQTKHGNIVVNGIVASTFTEAVRPILATALLAPLRWLFTVSGFNASPLLVTV